MIVFDLTCSIGHRFEAWFASSGAYADQRKRALVACPHCGITEVEKAPMAPAVPTKGNSRSDEPAKVLANAVPPAVAKVIRALAEAQSKVLKDSTWVGDKFAETSRAMHYGEREHASVHGRATPEEAKALVDEGVRVNPLPFPVAPPDELN